jgi:hypothetical protein
MRAEEHPGGIRTWHFDFDGREVLAAVSARTGGCSTGPYGSLNLGDHVGDDPARVRANRERLCAALGVDRLTIADQRHGTHVTIVDRALEGAGHESQGDAERRLPATDALATNLPGVALGMLVADCAPVVLWDPVMRAIAAVHAGRRGAVADVLGRTIATMVDAFGTNPADLVAGIGPCVGPWSYEIGPAEVAEVRAAFDDRTLLSPTRDGHATFDLPAAVRVRLRAAGVRPERIESAGVDTRAMTDVFFSDRAARPCGRFALVASIHRD